MRVSHKVIALMVGGSICHPAHPAASRAYAAVAAFDAGSAHSSLGCSASQATLLPQADTIPRVGEYRVYTGSGEVTSLEAVVTAMATKEVILIGESHNDLTGHHIEKELLSKVQAAYGSGATESRVTRPVTLSLEMFERDVQHVVDEYVNDLITEDQFLKSSRPWTEYDTDYRPLVEFAKEHGLKVLAANAPRRYANMVTRLGREALRDLSPRALETLPPLPYGMPSAEYELQWRQAMVDAMEELRERCPPPSPMAHGTGPDSAPHQMPMMAHKRSSNPLHAQALWDASMAYSITQHLMRQPDALVLHMAGSFHVERGTGTPEHLQRYRPGTAMMIVVLRPVEDVGAFDPERDGQHEDFVVLTDESVTRPVPCAAVGR